MNLAPPDPPLLIRPATAAERRAHQLAASLAKPVVRGHISGSACYATLALAAAAIPEAPPDFLGGLWHALKLHVRAERGRREMAEHHIARALAPMIGRRDPPNALRAAAHDVNGREGFPFAEPEVEEIAATEVWFSLPPAPAGRRRGV